jgi:hypothetical protein
MNATRGRLEPVGDVRMDAVLTLRRLAMPKKARKQAAKKPKIKDLKSVKNVKGGSLTAGVNRTLTTTGLKISSPISSTSIKVAY